MPIQFVCPYCNKTFTRSMSKARQKERAGKSIFCSRACQRAYEDKNRHRETCANCGKVFPCWPFEAKKSVNHFCSKSCAAQYNNTHKTYGTRRSKLEAFIEEQLRIDFPNLTLICNSRDVIGSELDFYFPQLRLAIELNGILHYEPIYGDDKLERIKLGDQQKFLACNAAGIELCVIDVSRVTYGVKSTKVRYYAPIKELVARLSGRATS